MQSKTLNQLRQLAIENKEQEDHPYYSVKDNDPYMPFWFEYVIKDQNGKEIWSIAHWGLQNGDVMRDPDIELSYDPETDVWVPLSFRNDYAGVFEESMTTAKIKDREAFLDIWLENLVDQGFVPEGGG